LPLPKADIRTTKKTEKHRNLADNKTIFIATETKRKNDLFLDSFDQQSKTLKKL
jgi:hypothetical protein